MKKENKIKWCLKQKKGIELIEANLNLSKSYLERAKKDLINLEKQDDVVWKVIISYYVCYNSFYSILFRYGIKSEIHSCTIELLELFDNLNEYKEFLEELKDQRTNVQYYLKEPKDIDLNKIKEFLDTCELELNEVNETKIKNLKFKLI